MVAWIKGIPGVPPSVATSVPEDNSSWAASGFVQVTPIGGGGDMYTPLNNPMVQVDCYAVALSSGKPPWGRANVLAQRIVNHTREHRLVPRVVTLGYGYGQARVLSVYPASGSGEPRRMAEVGETSRARYMVELACHWVAL
jgi:hypothetical protein